MKVYGIDLNGIKNHTTSSNFHGERFMSSNETNMAVSIFLSLEFHLNDRFLSLQGPFNFHFNLCWHPSYSSLWGNWGNRFDKFWNHPNDISFSRWVDFDTSPFLKSSKIPMGQIYRGPLYTLPNLNCISCIHCPVFYFIIPFGYFTYTG